MQKELQMFWFYLKYRRNRAFYQEYYVRHRAVIGKQLLHASRHVSDENVERILHIAGNDCLSKHATSAYNAPSDADVVSAIEVFEHENQRSACCG